MNTAANKVTTSLVLAFLRRNGFEAALNKPRERHLPIEKRFRNGVRVIKHPLKHGWVGVEYHFNGSESHTHDEWVDGAKKVFDALSSGPFLVNWVDGNVGAMMEVTGI